MDDKVVGHKTFFDEKTGLFRHEPLKESEAAGLLQQIANEEAARAALMPTEQDAIRLLWDAWYRLKELGWKSAEERHFGERPMDVIEIGSTGIHRRDFCAQHAILCRPASLLVSDDRPSHTAGDGNG